MTLVLTNVGRLLGNPYLDLWNEAVTRSGARQARLTRAAVLRRAAPAPDVVHLQWPERALVGGGRLLATTRLAGFVVLLVAARLRGARLLVTIHNTWSHDRRHWWHERLLWRVLATLTTDVHLLSAASADEVFAAHPRLRAARRHVIPHVNYATVAGRPPSQREARQALGLPADTRIFLTFGALKRYKGAAELLDALPTAAPSDLLLVAGRVLEDDLQRAVDAAVATGRVVQQAGYIPDDQLVRLIAASDIVVLPYTRVLNSGSAILALTAGRPVLLPRTATFEDLRRRVGAPWVQLYDGRPDFGAVVIPEGDAAPDLGWCDLPVVTEQVRALWPALRRS